MFEKMRKTIVTALMAIAGLFLLLPSTAVAKEQTENPINPYSLECLEKSKAVSVANEFKFNGVNVTYSLTYYPAKESANITKLFVAKDTSVDLNIKLINAVFTNANAANSNVPAKVTTFGTINAYNFKKMVSCYNTTTLNYYMNQSASMNSNTASAKYAITNFNVIPQTSDLKFTLAATSSTNLTITNLKFNMNNSLNAAFNKGCFANITNVSMIASAKTGHNALWKGEHNITTLKKATIKNYFDTQTSVSGKVTYKAATYKVTFNANGGTCSTASKNVTYGETYGTLPTPTKKDSKGVTMIFKGWYTAASGGSQITKTTKVTITSNTTLYAQWGYEITLSANGGKFSDDSTSIKIYPLANSSVSLSSYIPTKAGYHCTDASRSWATNAAGTTGIVATGNKVTANTKMTLYYRWSANTYKAFFVPDEDATGSSSKTVTYNAKFGELPESTKPGWELDYWYYDANDNGKQDTNEYKITADTVCKIVLANNATITMRAVYKPQTYNITFNPNNGTFSDGTTANKIIEYTVGNTYTNLPVVTREGYDFAGWLVNGVIIKNGDEIVLSADATAVAQWTPYKYKIIFDIQCDAAGVNDFKEGLYGYVEHGSDITDLFITDADTQSKVEIDFPTNPSRTSYIFDGWYLTASPTANEIEYKTGVKFAPSGANSGDTFTLYARWYTSTVDITVNVCSYDNNYLTYKHDKVTYNTKYYDSLPLDQYVEAGAKKKPGYEFAGWYYDSSFKESTKITVDTAINSNNGVTYSENSYAIIWGKWVPKTYTITFKTDDYCTCSTKTKTVKYGEKIGTLPAVTAKEGYTFTGWYASATSTTPFTETTVYTYDKDITLVSHCSANEYTATFNPIGGKINGKKGKLAVNVVFGTKYRFAFADYQLPTPTWEKHTFKGWFTKKNGKGTQVTEDTFVSIAKNHTLYAHWKAEKVKVTFKANGGKLVGKKTKKVNYDEKYGKLPKCKKAGYAFTGWYTKKVGGTKITAKSIVSLKLPKKQTLYAHYKKISIGKAKLKGLSSTATGKLTVKYKKMKVNGYQIMIATNKKFTSNKTVQLIKGKKNVKYTFSGLKSGKKYYVKVRAYKKDSTGKLIYGKWSKVKTIKVK